MTPLWLRIREHRLRRGLTQAQLAKQVHVRQATISELERRPVRRLDVALLERISKALKVSTTALIAETPSKRETR